MKTKHESSGEEPSSFTRRLSGFLTSTINKTKSIISEVLDEKNDEESEECFVLFGIDF